MESLYPQLEVLFHWLILTYAILAPLAVALYARQLFLKDFPGKRKINELHIEMSDFSGMVADLTDRFNKFQKRQGMRDARADRSDQESVLQEAQRIAAEATPVEAGDDKLALYRKVRH